MTVSQILVRVAQLLLDTAVTIEGTDMSLISEDLQRAETQAANLRNAIANLKTRSAAPTLDAGEPERLKALADALGELVNFTAS